MFLTVFCPTPGKEPGLFDLVIVNDNLDEAYVTLKQALSEVGPFPPALCGEVSRTSHPVKSANPVDVGLHPWCAVSSQGSASC